MVSLRKRKDGGLGPPTFLPVYRCSYEYRGGSRKSKSCGLGRVGFPLWLPSVAGWSFPFKAAAERYRPPLPDCHLVRTAILHLPLGERQPRCFPQHRATALSSFAGKISRGNIALGRGHGRKRFAPRSQLTHARQATLHTAHDSAHRDAGSIPVSYAVRAPSGEGTGRLSHDSRSPRNPGRLVYAITPRPKTLTPSTHPNLGEKSKHQGLHRYAL